MDNQHKLIKGYRDLTQAEIDAMNALKAKAAELQTLIAQTEDMLIGIDRLGSDARRCIAIARTELQTGFMWAIRAVAQPQGFA